jgi:hypothetical protein
MQALWFVKTQCADVPSNIYILNPECMCIKLQLFPHSVHKFQMKSSAYHHTLVKEFPYFDDILIFVDASKSVI